MSNNPNNGGPAFPFTGCGTDGMALRDYFAAKAMAAMITGKSSSSYKQTSSNAYELADAMLAARSNVSGEVSDLLTQRDELLAALKLAEPLVECTVDISGYKTHKERRVLVAVRKAIAKAEQP